MNSVMTSLTGKKVTIEQTGDSEGTGRLINSQTDYASIWNNQQLTHYPFTHIKAVSTNITERAEVVPVPDVALPNTFSELLQSLRMKMVRIENGNGSRVGVLSSVSDDSVSVIVDMKKMSFYPLEQIKSVSPVYKIPSAGGAESTDSSADGDTSSSQEGNADEDMDTRNHTDSSSSDGKHHHKRSSRSDDDDSVPNMFELDTARSSRRHRKSSRSSGHKTRSVVSISNPSPSFVKEKYAANQRSK